jgi:hypothetical protein
VYVPDRYLSRMKLTRSIGLGTSLVWIAWKRCGRRGLPFAAADIASPEEVLFLDSADIARRMMGYLYYSRNVVSRVYLNVQELTAVDSDSGQGRS